MAKKKPETTTAVALPSDIVNVAVNLDKDDVAAILMSRAEEHLKGQIKEHVKIDKQCDKARNALTKKLDTQCRAVLDAYFEDTIDLLKTAASQLKAKSIDTSIQCHGHDPNQGRKQGSVRGTLQIAGRKPNIRWTVDAAAPAGAAVAGIVAEIAANETEQQNNSTEWYAVRKKLADLPSLERRAKAAVAEQRLMATTEGAELVDMLGGQLEESIKLLGVS